MKYNCVKQHDNTDCGAACIATICRQQGYNISISKIREIAGTDKRGTNVYGMIQALNTLRFKVKGVKTKEINNDILREKISLPCIAHVIVNDSLLHYVVIYKITKKHIIIADPAEGVMKIRIDEFIGKSETAISISGQVCVYFLLKIINFIKHLQRLMYF